MDLGIDYPVSVARTGWRYVGDEPVIKQRATELRVHDRGRLISHVQAWEFRTEPFALERFDFFSLMDAESDEAQRLAEVVLSCWVAPFEDLTDYGNLLLIDFAWSPPDARHPIWALTLEAALPSLFGMSAGMFAQAFPTQYAGNLPGPCPARVGFRRRQAAMLRHYDRLLGLRPLPGWAGSKGWVWRMLNTAVLDPEANCDGYEDYASDDDDD